MLTTNSSLMDGINRHILNTAPVINKYPDCEVAVCTVFPKAEFAEALEKEDVRTFSLHAANGHDAKIFYAFYKVMQEYKPDIIHSHVMAFYEKFLLSIFYRSKKFVLTIHGIPDKVEHESFRLKFDRWLNNVFSIRFDATCYISNGVREQLAKDKNLQNIYTIYNPLHFYDVKAKEYKIHKLIGVPEETIIIGTCCRFATVKNPEMFTRVMCKVLQEKEHVHAVILGDGDEAIKQHMKSIIAEANVSERFHLLGYRKDASELIRDFNCFVMTSTSEGLPTSILEAMNCRTPFAMMEGNGGLKDLAEIHRSEGPIGIVEPPSDVETLANKICNLIDKPEYARVISDKAFEIGRHYFDVENVCKHLHQVYKNIMKQR